jgi:hypothetical protein
MPLLIDRGEEIRSAADLADGVDPIESLPIERSRPEGLDRRRRPKAGLFEVCANPGCRSGWLQLWRRRSVPVFESGWTCSAECTAARVHAAVVRELDGHSAGHESHHHRIPMGLLMLENGWITHTQLRKALEAQKEHGTGRLGEWLVKHGAVNEAMVTRALALQWSCPVLPIEFHDTAAMTSVMPRLFMDAYGALPLQVAGTRVLYLGFEASLDPVLALALERMTGMRVESGILQQSSFRPAHAEMLEAKFPTVELVQASSQSAAVRVLARSVERARPTASRLVRVHDWLWLRMFLHTQKMPLAENHAVQDIVCSIGAL